MGNITKNPGYSVKYLTEYRNPRIAIDVERKTLYNEICRDGVHRFVKKITNLSPRCLVLQGGKTVH